MDLPGPPFRAFLECRKSWMKEIIAENHNYEMMRGLILRVHSGLVICRPATLASGIDRQESKRVDLDTMSFLDSPWHPIPTISITGLENWSAIDV